MEVFVVTAFNKDGFYVVSVADNLILARTYADAEWKERKGNYNMRVYRKVMNASHTIKDEIVYTK
jgi:hypothetical protein